MAEAFWLVRDYLPESVELDRERMPAIGDLAAWMGGAEIEVVPVPHDCRDGFFGAYWRRPQAYLDPVVRAGMSNLALLGEPAERAVAALRRDLASGAWQQRNGELLDLDELDLGYRLLTAER
jgi:hypothetical protein